MKEFAVCNAETGKICCGKILCSLIDLSEEYGCYTHIGNRKQMRVHKKGMQACIFSDYEERVRGKRKVRGSYIN